MSDTPRVPTATTPAQPQTCADPIHPKNSLGPAAVVFGLVGMIVALLPSVYLVGAIIGVVGVLVGLAGHRRCRRGVANNGRVAMLGAVISGAACVMACIRAVIVLAA